MTSIDDAFYLFVFIGITVALIGIFTDFLKRPKSNHEDTEKHDDDV